MGIEDGEILGRCFAPSCGFNHCLEARAVNIDAGHSRARIIDFGRFDRFDLVFFRHKGPWWFRAAAVRCDCSWCRFPGWHRSCSATLRPSPTRRSAAACRTALDEMGRSRAMKNSAGLCRPPSAVIRPVGLRTLLRDPDRSAHPIGMSSDWGNRCCRLVTNPNQGSR